MIRVGLVGFGMAGRVFHAPLISSVEGLELAAVLERSSDKAAQRYPGITTYRSLEAMLEDASIGLFVVAVPSPSHFEVARQILQAGKNIIVDKPVCTSSAEVAQLMELAATRKAFLIPFHNRRWDSDFQTIQKLLHEGLIGRLVDFESRMDRWRPDPPVNRLWKEEPSSGGVLLDLGTHLADQALALFGKPEAVTAEILCERDWARACDAFTVRLRYSGFRVTLGANNLSAQAKPRFHLRGTRGNYWKWGVDPQEAALNKITRITDPDWGREPASEWGALRVSANGSLATRAVEPVNGDYRRFYAGVRDALLGRAAAPVPAVAAWRVARLLEWAMESSNLRREVPCDWEHSDPR